MHLISLISYVINHIPYAYTHTQDDVYTLYKQHTVRVYICMYIYIYIYICVCVCSTFYIHTTLHAYTYISIYIYAYIIAYVYIYIYISTTLHLYNMIDISNIIYVFIYVYRKIWMWRHLWHPIVGPIQVSGDPCHRRPRCPRLKALRPRSTSVPWPGGSWSCSQAWRWISGQDVSYTYTYIYIYSCYSIYWVS